MGQAAAVLKALQCPCFTDCAKYVFNAAHCRSSCCGCSCSCDTDAIELQEEKEPSCLAGLIEHICPQRVKADACHTPAKGYT